MLGERRIQLSLEPALEVPLGLAMQRQVEHRCVCVATS
jgi:hypothetical protein